LIREQDNLLHFGVIDTVGTSNKALVAQQKDKSLQQKKQHPRNNKQNKDPKLSQPTSTPNGDKGPKPKIKKTDRHWKFLWTGWSSRV
jgi:hypothetical protein